jgi:hypothetical protein
MARRKFIVHSIKKDGEGTADVKSLEMTLMPVDEAGADTVSISQTAGSEIVKVNISNAAGITDPALTIGSEYYIDFTDVP